MLFHGGVKVISYSRRTVFQMAEVAVSEKVFRALLSRIHGLGRSLRRAPVLSCRKSEERKPDGVRWSSSVSKYSERSCTSKQELKDWRGVLAGIQLRGQMRIDRW